MKSIAILLPLLLMGCQSLPGSFCKVATIHSFADATVDAMTQEEVNREEAYNELVAKCPAGLK